MSELETVFFIHVPKTAGTSFRRALSETFPGRLAWDYGASSDSTSPWVRRCIHEAADRELFRSELQRRRIVVFGGHVSYDEYADIFEPEQTISLVRDPVQRVVAEWHHHRRETGLGMTLEQFAAHRGEPNKQTRMLGGVELDRYGLIGLTSHYREWLDLVSIRFDWPLPHLEENRNPEREAEDLSYPIGPVESARIMELNRHDIGLYRRAVELLRPRLSEVRPELSDAPIRGFLDRYEDGFVYGWACRLGDPAPLSIRVLVDGREFTVVTADRVRNDLRKKGIHPTGRAGFMARVGPLASTSIVQCFVQPSGWELGHSPYRVEDPDSTIDADVSRLGG